MTDKIAITKEKKTINQVKKIDDDSSDEQPKWKTITSNSNVELGVKCTLTKAIKPQGLKVK